MSRVEGRYSGQEGPKNPFRFLTVWLCAQVRRLSGLRTEPNGEKTDAGNDVQALVILRRRVKAMSSAIPTHPQRPLTLPGLHHKLFLIVLRAWDAHSAYLTN